MNKLEIQKALEEAWESGHAAAITYGGAQLKLVGQDKAARILNKYAKGRNSRKIPDDMNGLDILDELEGALDNPLNPEPSKELCEAYISTMGRAYNEIEDLRVRIEKRNMAIRKAAIELDEE